MPDQNVLNILRMLRPHRLETIGKVRLGRDLDGGYVMVDRFDGVQAAYSIGIKDDDSWDRDTAARGIPVFQYDHTIDATPSDHPLITWRKIGLAGLPSEEARLQTLPAMLRENGHEESGNLVLKCDIEGAEWEVLALLDGQTLRRFSQIVLELHFLHRLADDAFRTRAHRAIANLTAAHRVVHVHGNNHGRFAIANGVAVPMVLELTFVRADLGRLTPSDESFPTPLDRPCKTGTPDLYLGQFRYD